jgi:hypothetical protein
MRRPSVTRRACVLSLALAPWGVRAQAAAPAEVAAELPAARLLGNGRLTFFGLHVYDARLWVAEGFSAERFAAHPLAIELEYARTLYGNLIAERSLEEMKRAGALGDAEAQRWLDTMKRIFPDVSKGDRITGLQRPGESTRFFVNAALRGEVRDADFTRRFFGIWLAPQTSEPKLRQALLGPGKAPS